jgi:hypothetical protein
MPSYPQQRWALGSSEGGGVLSVTPAKEAGDTSAVRHEGTAAAPPKERALTCSRLGVALLKPSHSPSASSASASLSSRSGRKSRDVWPSKDEGFSIRNL